MQPGEGNALLKVRLEDASGTSYDLIIKGGDKSIQEIPLGTNPLTPGGSRKYGDFDPSFGHIQMTSWERGWGGYDFSDDEFRFDRSVNMWTATKNNIFSVPYWTQGGDPQGACVADLSASGSVRMSLPLTGSTGYYSTKVNPTTGFTAENLFIWAMFRGDYTSGTRPNITAYIYDDNAGEPGSIVATGTTVYVQDEDMKVWKCHQLTFSGYTMTGGTDYHIVLKVDVGATGEDLSEFIVRPPYRGSGHKSTDASTWSFADGFAHYLHGGRTRAKASVFFELARTPFKLVSLKNGTTNGLYMMGDHGLATAGTSTTLTDSNEGVRGAWTAGQWAQDLLIIVAGTGAGQERTITTNDTAGQITVSSAWGITPDATSEYAIISFTEDWYKVPSGTHGLTSSKSVTVAQNIAYFSKGYGANMKRMRFNASALQFADDGTNDADIVTSAGGLVWKCTDDDGKIAYASYQDWGTNLAFTDLSQVTPTGFNFTGANLHGGNIYFFKENAVWFLDPSAKILYPFPVNHSYFTNSNCGLFSDPAEEYLYFSWGHTLQRISGLSGETVNYNRDKGLPSDYRGKVYGIVNGAVGIMFGINGGKDGISTVNVYDGVAFHNAFTSEMPGVEVQDIAWYVSETGDPRLMIALGEATIIQQYPKDGLNPLEGGAGGYAQGMLETTTIDMGGKVIPKFFKDIVAFVEDAVYLNGVSYDEFVIYYQADGGDWTYLTSITTISRGESETSFSDPTLSTINALSNVRELKLRFYAIGGNARCYAVTLKGFARTPIKSVYTFPIDVSAVTERLGSGAPEAMMNQFWTWAQSAEALLMTSQHNRLHNKSVIIIPRSIRTQYIDRSNEVFAVDFYLELREV